MLEALELRLDDTERVNLAGWRCIVSIAAFKNCTPQLCAALGVALPEAPVCITDGGITFIWSGPGAWLAVGDDPMLLGRLESGAQKLAAITDQSDGRVIFQVSGEMVWRSLGKLIPIDLHPASFAVDATAMTLAGHIGIQIWREGESFAIACLRSYADSLYHSLCEAI